LIKIQNSQVIFSFFLFKTNKKLKIKKNLIGLQNPKIIRMIKYNDQTKKIKSMKRKREEEQIEKLEESKREIEKEIEDKGKEIQEINTTIEKIKNKDVKEKKIEITKLDNEKEREDKGKEIHQTNEKNKKIKINEITPTTLASLPGISSLVWNDKLELENQKYSKFLCYNNSNSIFKFKCSLCMSKVHQRHHFKTEEQFVQHMKDKHSE
jgi:hypothetical protein